MPAFERLLAWQLCYRLGLEVYQATKSWPAEERYGLTSQARRAAVSAVTNIAEGASKHGPAEFRRYLDIALGSLGELACLLLFARDLGILPYAQWDHLDTLRRQAGGLTWKLARAMERRGQRR